MNSLHMVLGWSQRMYQSQILDPSKFQSFPLEFSMIRRIPGAVHGVKREE